MKVDFRLPISDLRLKPHRMGAIGSGSPQEDLVPKGPEKAAKSKWRLRRVSAEDYAPK